MIYNENNSRRTGIERRMFLYSAHFPERRSGIDRRETGSSPRDTENEKKRKKRETHDPT